MALVGFALGNSIIFITHNSFDRFTEVTSKKLSLGNKKLKKMFLEVQYFSFL